MNIEIYFSMKEYTYVIQFIYVMNNIIHKKEMEGVSSTPYLSARLDSAQIQSLISFLNDALIASQQSEKLETGYTDALEERKV